MRTSKAGRKRKAVDLEAEAEEHQKRREEQYQSLLAPSPLPPSIQSTSLPLASGGNTDHSLPHYPALPDVQLPPNQSFNLSTMAPPFNDGPIPELENMGYIQVIVLYYFLFYLYIRF